MWTRLLLVLALVLPCSVARAQQPPGHRPSTTDSRPDTPAPAGASAQDMNGDSRFTQVMNTGATTTRWHEPVEIIFSIAVLAFGAGLIVLFTAKVSLSPC